MDAYPQVVRVRPSTPWLKFHNARRGYIRCDITPAAWRSDYRMVPSIQTAQAPVITVASFVTPAGRSVVEPA